MKHLNILNAGVGFAALGLALISAPAMADQATPAAAPEAKAEAIIVTGSRIAVSNATTANPISVTSSAEIQLTKAISVEDVLARMVGPDLNGITATSNNGGSGESTVSLRNLGSQRTLVLIDGNRVIPDGYVVDLNVIPFNSIDRIEVLRDGASSIYGADAIGGVVNIITKRDGDGVTLNTGLGANQHGGGFNYHLGTTIGLKNDRGGLLVGFNWDHTDALYGYQRDWANDPAIGTDAEGGSAYRSQLDVLQSESPVVLTNPTVVNGVLQPAGTKISGLVAIGGQFYTRSNPAIAALAPNLLDLPNVGVVKLNANGSAQTPWNTLAGSNDRRQLTFAGHYELTPDVTILADAFYTKRQSTQLLRPEPLLGDTIATFNPDGSTLFPGLIIAANAPGNTTGTSYAAYLTPTQFGPRTYVQNKETWRAHLALKGTFGKDFRWEIGGVEQESTEDLAIGNSGNWLHLGELEGQLPCIDVPGGCTNGSPNVQPNWFAGPNNIFSPAQLAYVEYTRHDSQEASERFAYANISGSLFNLPAGKVAASVGGEYRGEHLTYTPDQLTSEGFTANASAPTNGGYNVKSIFGELFVPLLADKPFAKSLNLTASGRYDNYNLFGGASTYKIGANWSLFDDIRFRASYNTGFRAPQVTELYGGQGVSDIGASGDPCETNSALKAGGNTNVGKGVLTAGSKCSTAVANGAAVTSFSDPLDQIGGSQIQTLVGGNPNLQPEKSRSYSFGTVITPTFMKGFSFEADYYRTKVTNVVLTGGIGQNFGLDYLLLDCYGANQNQVSCAKIHRNSQGVITQIDSLNDNGGTQTVRGIDFQATYDTRRAGITLPIPGSVRIDFQLEHLIQNDQVDLTGAVTPFAGYFNVGQEEVYPKWRAFTALDYRVGGWIFHYDNRFSSPISNFDGSAPAYGNYIGPVWYHSISVAYTFEKLGFLTNTRIVGGIDNLFDKNPPYINSDSTCKCNSIAGPYDFNGRSFYVKLSTKF